MEVTSYPILSEAHYKAAVTKLIDMLTDGVKMRYYKEYAALENSVTQWERMQERIRKASKPEKKDYLGDRKAQEIRDLFFTSLERKTGWGRNEIKAEYNLIFDGIMAGKNVKVTDTYTSTAEDIEYRGSINLTKIIPNQLNIPDIRRYDPDEDGETPPFDITT